MLEDHTEIDYSNHVPKMARKYCRENAITIQLVGCKVRYEAVGFPEISNTEFEEVESGTGQCKWRSVVTGGGFEGRKDSGSEEVESGMGGGGSGFYVASYGSVIVMGQCEEIWLGRGSDCEDCVKMNNE
ncbi:plasmodesmata-located protein 2-like [Silene latifolia]|uniref:plasmodesmata-located protein 2-like n=1 Tax=Silene latifolia TaxID=37657 RepID=UPI003D7802CE